MSGQSLATIWLSRVGRDDVATMLAAPGTLSAAWVGDASEQAADLRLSVPEDQSASLARALSITHGGFVISETQQSTTLHYSGFILAIPVQDDDTPAHSLLGRIGGQQPGWFPLVHGSPISWGWDRDREPDLDSPKPLIRVVISQAELDDVISASEAIGLPDLTWHERRTTSADIPFVVCDTDPDTHDLGIVDSLSNELSVAVAGALFRPEPSGSFTGAWAERGSNSDVFTSTDGSDLIDLWHDVMIRVGGCPADVCWPNMP